MLAGLIDPNKQWEYELLQRPSEMQESLGVITSHG